MKKLNFIKKHLLIKFFVIICLFIFQINLSAAQQTAQQAQQSLTIEDYNQNCNSSINEEDYNFMKEIIADKKKNLTNFITFLDQPLSTKNNVFIKQTCEPIQIDGQTRYDCKSKVTCVCKPQFPDITADDDKKNGINCRRVQFITYKTGQELAAKYINLIYRWVSSIVGIIAVIYIIVNGIIISSAQNDSGQVTAAKDRIVQSLIALVVLLSASLILYAINPTFFTADIVETQQTQ